MTQKSAAPQPIKDCILRTASFNDYDGIQGATRRNGIKSPAFEDWARLWTDNPYWSEETTPIGWVLESPSMGIVGTLGSIPRVYEYNGKPVRAVAANAWAVDPAFRHAAVSLAAEFFAQDGVDLFLSTTASPSAGMVYKAFGCEEVPGPSCAEIRYWITGPVGFAGAVLEKKKWPAWLLKHVVGGALFCADLRRTVRVRSDRDVVEVLRGFDERFDVFWERLRLTPDRLLAVRNHRALDWQFRRVRRSGEVVVLGLKRRAGLGGYLIMNRFDEPRSGLRRFRVVDLQVLEEESDGVCLLMNAALRHAREVGVHVVEAMGFNAATQRALDELRPRRRVLPSSPYLYKATPMDLASALAHAEVWNASPFDGDAAL
jgi:hypothetical protein